MVGIHRQLQLCGVQGVYHYECCEYLQLLIQIPWGDRIYQVHLLLDHGSLLVAIRRLLEVWKGCLLGVLSAKLICQRRILRILLLRLRGLWLILR